MYAVGVWIYMRATRPLDGVGRWSFVALALFLFVAYFANLSSGPPPSVQMIWVSAIIGIGDAVGLDLVDGSTPRAAVPPEIARSHDRTETSHDVLRFVRTSLLPWLHAVRYARRSQSR